MNHQRPPDRLLCWQASVSVGHSNPVGPGTQNPRTRYIRRQADISSRTLGSVDPTSTASSRIDASTGKPASAPSQPDSGTRGGIQGLESLELRWQASFDRETEFPSACGSVQSSRSSPSTGKPASAPSRSDHLPAASSNRPASTSPLASQLRHRHVRARHPQLEGVSRRRVLRWQASISPEAATRPPATSVSEAIRGVLRWQASISSRAPRRVHRQDRFPCRMDPSDQAAEASRSWGPPIARPAQVHSTATRRAAGPRSRATRGVSVPSSAEASERAGRLHRSGAGPADVAIALTGVLRVWRGRGRHSVQAASRPDLRDEPLPKRPTSSHSRGSGRLTPYSRPKGRNRSRRVGLRKIPGKPVHSHRPGASSIPRERGLESGVPKKISFDSPPRHRSGVQSSPEHRSGAQRRRAMIGQVAGSGSLQGI
jgi:hypothetical protein